MNTGILLFAHNTSSIDYVRLAILSAQKAKKNLKISVSLVTDKSTLDWAEKSNLTEKIKIFDNIIVTDRPNTTNQRLLHDGDSVDNVSFLNTNRQNAYELTPYDRTLLIDSDFLIFSDVLNNFWNIDQSVIISNGMIDIRSDRLRYLDFWTSEVGPKLMWATCVMFSKNEESKIFFDLVNYVRENYEYYSDLFRFNPRQYRNDISFSIAEHIMYGFQDIERYHLPKPLLVLGKDDIIKIEKSKIKFLLDDPLEKNYTMVSVSGSDLHIMNKQSMIRNFDDIENKL